MRRNPVNPLIFVTDTDPLENESDGQSEREQYLKKKRSGQEDKDAAKSNHFHIRNHWVSSQEFSSGRWGFRAQERAGHLEFSYPAISATAVSREALVLIRWRKI